MRKCARISKELRFIRKCCIRWHVYNWNNFNSSYYVIFSQYSSFFFHLINLLTNLISFISKTENLGLLISYRDSINNIYKLFRRSFLGWLESTLISIQCFVLKLIIQRYNLLYYNDFIFILCILKLVTFNIFFRPSIESRRYAMH